MKEILSKETKRTIHHMMTDEMIIGTSFVLRKKTYYDSNSSRDVYYLYVLKRIIENVFVEYNCEAKLIEFNSSSRIPDMEINKEYKAEELGLC